MIGSPITCEKKNVNVWEYVARNESGLFVYRQEKLELYMCSRLYMYRPEKSELYMYSLENLQAMHSHTFRVVTKTVTYIIFYLSPSCVQSSRLESPRLETWLLCEPPNMTFEHSIRNMFWDVSGGSLSRQNKPSFYLV